MDGDAAAHMTDVDPPQHEEGAVLGGGVDADEQVSGDRECAMDESVPVAGENSRSAPTLHDSEPRFRLGTEPVPGTEARTRSEARFRAQLGSEPRTHQFPSLGGLVGCHLVAEPSDKARIRGSGLCT